MPDVPPPARLTRGAGVFTHAEIETVDLGVHAGRRFRAQVEHRVIRIAWGRRRIMSLMLGRRRAARIEALSIEATTGATGDAPAERYDVLIPHVPDPWPQLALRVTVVAVTCLLTTAFVERLVRGKYEGRGRT